MTSLHAYDIRIAEVRQRLRGHLPGDGGTYYGEERRLVHWLGELEDVRYSLALAAWASGELSTAEHCPGGWL